MNWMYRVLENDDEGDPLQFGVVSADSFIEAQQLVAADLQQLLEDTYEEVPVRFYEVTKHTGCWETSDQLIDIARNELATGKRKGKGSKSNNGKRT